MLVKVTPGVNLTNPLLQTAYLPESYFEGKRYHLLSLLLQSTLLVNTASNNAHLSTFMPHVVKHLQKKN